MPDFNFAELRRLSTTMQKLAALPREHKNYAAAQVALEELRADYNAMRDDYQTKYATDPANPQRALATPEAEEMSGANADLGAVAAGRMAFSQVGLPFGLAELVGSVSQGVPLQDVRAQTRASQAAHPTATTIGTGAGVATALLTPRGVYGAGTTIAKGQSARIAAKKAALELAEMQRKLAPEIAAYKAAKVANTAAVAKSAATAPASSVVAKVAAEKAVATTAEVTQSAAQQLSTRLAQAKAEELAIQAIAKTNALIKAGFSIEDAAQMVKTGVHVTNDMMQPFMRAARVKFARDAARAAAQGVAP